MRETLLQLAPGTHLRDGLERIKRGHTGALIVLGSGPEVAAVCDGGIEFDASFTPTLLRELSKMDGAVILTDDATRITRANVQLVPSPTFHTSETGTRHRAAERTALQTGAPVISVSASMNVVTVYAAGQRHPIEEPGVLMTRARQLRLQLIELRGTIDEDITMLVSDYIVADGVPPDALIDASLRDLSILPDSELLNTAALARLLGLPATEENVMEAVTPRGYRVLSRIPRVQKFLIDHIVSEFGTLDAIRAADAEALVCAEHVSPLWARHIVEGLRRIA